VSGYGWDQLVSSMHQGNYEMIMQSGLSDIIDLKSKAGRPPIYAVMLFFFTQLGRFASIIAVFFQSIITSLVAYIGYKIINTTTRQKRIAMFCFVVLFLFPMNFLKSGTIDEAPLMLVFLLTSLYVFIMYIKNQNKYILLILSGILLGLSTLTRLVVLPVAFGILIFLLAYQSTKHKKVVSISLFICSYLLILSPWIYRNFRIYGQPVLTVGSSRIFLFTQTEEFIKSFPEKSPDVIEREYLIALGESNKELRNLDIITLDRKL
ncbi:unnamed protein product, partial [marine sediment metagenome]